MRYSDIFVCVLFVVVYMEMSNPVYQDFGGVSAVFSVHRGAVWMRGF
ncbi:hypothetical protein SLEP1_g58768 [Rubroshorea leprosula]|uniref:Uncharacterized protein n=1 Tax=Rubroshorea leprosula TaxID=152421 RepID=A0AAV5MUI8_9ROSI|nr:hypothetical protein SLEP1_g58768 [Rubroshorea leprosula]